MSIQLFVGSLAYDVTEAELREAFSVVAPPLSVRIPIDRATGKPRGFAFVEFSDAAQAEEAIRRFHQQVFKGRPLVVNEARPREEGAGFRSSPLAQGSRPAGLGPPDRGPRPDQVTRTFGPDAPPRGKRRPAGRGSKGERGPKGPIRERGGGQFFAEGVDDPQDDQGGDDVPFWLRTASDTKEEE
jgi:RNA recognition motif-containing protein